MGPWPSKLASEHSPVRAAAASNRRPADVVCGVLRRRCQACCNSDGTTGICGQSLPVSQQTAAALRLGSRPARSPPGRKKDLIIRAGENVSPLTIENALMNHPAIAEAAAVGVADERAGERVKVCVVLREGTSATESDLKTFCRQKLPAFMVPDFFRFYNELPKTATGKILKTKLREENKS